MSRNTTDTAAQLRALVSQFRTQFAMGESTHAERVRVPFPDTQPFLSLDDLAFIFEEVLSLFLWRKEHLELMVDLSAVVAWRNPHTQEVYVEIESWLQFLEYLAQVAYRQQVYEPAITRIWWARHSKSKS